MNSTPPDDARPRIVGSFAQPDSVATPLLIAVGRVVLAVAGLENSLQMEYVRLVLSRPASVDSSDEISLAERLRVVENLTAGQLLRRLRELGLPTDLDERVAAVIRRRNELIHRTYEDPDLVRALDGGEHLQRTVGQLEQLAVDAGELAVELHQFALPRLEGLLDASLTDLVGLVRSLEPDAVTNERDRRQLEAVQAFLNSNASITDLSLEPSD